MTIKQPCAHLVVVGDKPIENRSKPWPSTLDLPCRIGIHAGKGDHAGCWDALRASEAVPSVDVVYGALIGFVTVMGFHHADKCEHFKPDRLCHPSALPGMWHYELVDPEPLDEPIPMRGALGLWRLPEGVAA